MKTTDGGLNWIHHINLPVIDYPKDIYFINADTGWIAGWSGVQISTDGGMSWEDQYIDDFAGESLSITPENTIWIAGYNRYYPHYGEIYRSNDWGNTWDFVLGDTVPSLNDIVFVNENTGWAVGDSGTILHTLDGGLTWEYQESGTETDLFSVSFADENHGWICGDSAVILYTDNGGITGSREHFYPSEASTKIYPNPVSDICSIELDLKQAGNVSIQVYDLLGDRTFELENRNLQKGINKIDWYVGGIKNGIYFCMIQLENITITKKIIKA